MPRRHLPFLVVLLAWSPLAAAEPPRGYQAKVQVANPTRLDWTFALSNQSLATPPADWLPNYHSAQQQYELFVPADYDAKKSYPVILFVSPSAAAMGWKSWEATCRKYGVIFAGPHAAGNDCPTRTRIRIVLDVLDDVRQNYRTDPDRTYISGFSGGGRIACGIGFALPELFGGIVPICAGGDLRAESWLRQRVIDRVSVALVTGEGDFNQGEVARYRGPMLKDVGVRAKVWDVPKLGHAVPAGRTLTEIFEWLEQDRDRRRDLAKRWPASRDAAPERKAAADALLQEGKKRLQDKSLLYSGLMQLQGCAARWPDLPAAAEAKKILEEYDGRKDRPWEADDLAEQRRFLLAQARGLDAYASGPLPANYAKMRPDMAKQAMRLWEQLLQDGGDPKAVQEAKQRLPKLRELLEKDSP